MGNVLSLFCVINEHHQYLSKNGTWMNDLRIFCCMKYEDALSLVLRRHLENETTIIPLDDAEISNL